VHGHDHDACDGCDCEDDGCGCGGCEGH
jgi:hypothetical protein